MIIRDFGLRHGRKALGSTTSACIRALSTTTTQAPPPATATPNLNPSDLGMSSSSSNPQQPPAIFSGKARRSAPRRKQAAAVDTTASDFANAAALRHAIGHKGADVEQLYSPSSVFRSPPAPEDVTLEMLMAAQSHMGHHTALWNPANARYIYGTREGIHVIALEQTAAHLRRAARVVEEVAYRGGLILFVGTRRGQMQVVTEAARMAKGCHLFSKWTPGSITNSNAILKGLQINMVDASDRPVRTMDRYTNEAPALIPDLVVCLNPLENFTMLHEASLVDVPTIGVVDTNVDPSWVTYQIPANDDSLRCINLIGSVLGKAGERGQKRRLADARDGLVPYESSTEIRSAQEKMFFAEELQKLRREEARLQAEMQEEREKADARRRDEDRE